MAFTGQGEAAAIISKLASVGTFYEDIADGFTPPVDWSGAPTPYGIVQFFDPVPAATGRSLGVSEQGQPYSFRFNVTYIAATTTAGRTFRASGDTALVGWTPVAGNSTAVKPAGGWTLPSRTVNGAPTDVRRVRRYHCFINGIVEELTLP